MAMRKKTARQYVIEHFAEVDRLFSEGVTLDKIHQRLTDEGKLCEMTEGYFRNLYAEIKKVGTEKVLSPANEYLVRIERGKAEFVKNKDKIIDIARRKSGVTERAYGILTREKKITMGLQVFHRLCKEQGIIQTVRKLWEEEFLKAKDKINQMMDEGVSAKEVYRILKESGEESGKFTMPFLRYRQFCLMYDVEMRLTNRPGYKTKEEREKEQENADR